jgi:5-formyltetrahydrofolate cyclo-ligase
MASTPQSNLLDEKRTMRRAMTERRRETSDDDRQRRSAAAASLFIALPELAAVAAARKIVSGYVAVKGEIDPAPILAAASALGAVVALPRISVAVPRLRFHLMDPRGVASAAALVRGPSGLLEPSPSLPEVAADDIDIMILPGLAFDRGGRRLGYGGGYYDEAGGRLRALGRGFLVGLGYDFQLVGRCPAGDGDVRIDCVVTDRQVVRCAGGGAAT